MNKTKDMEAMSAMSMARNNISVCDMLTGRLQTEKARQPTRADIQRLEAERAKAQEHAHYERCDRLRAAMSMLEAPLIASLNNFGFLINEQMNAQGFWESDNTGEKIALMHSELSEALEADRKNLDSDHIEGYTGLEEELADVIIRAVDFAVQKNLRLGDALFAKMRFNLTRPFKHGKAY